jgi:hypothetical protein
MVPDFEDFEECGEELFNYPQQPMTRMSAPPLSGPSVFTPINYDALASEFDVPVPC